MITRQLTKSDFDQIVGVIDGWVGGPTTALAHPIFFYELGEFARVVEHDGELIGFLFGFVSGANARTGYIHLVGVSPEYRRRGVARRLYDSFEASCRAAGCGKLKAVSPLGNEVSERFHDELGWQERVVEDYAGPGRHRVVFLKNL